MYESNLEYTLSDKYDPYFEKTLQNIFRIPAIIYVFLPSSICHINYPNLFPVVVQMADKHLNNSLITFSHCCEVV